MQHSSGCERCWIDGGWSIRTEFLGVKNVISEMTNLWNCIKVHNSDENQLSALKNEVVWIPSTCQWWSKNHNKADKHTFITNYLQY
jgi:hypothetical protein